MSDMPVPVDLSTSQYYSTSPRLPAQERHKANDNNAAENFALLANAQTNAGTRLPSL